MKKQLLKLSLILGIAMLTLSSCSTMNKSMREPNTRVELKKTDFTLSDQVSAEASSTKILMIDLSRLFNKNSGAIESDVPSSGFNIYSIPVIGGLLGATDETAGYALYKLMEENKGYDVVFYPQYTTKVSKPVLGIGFLMKITKVEVKARLGKLKK